MLTDFASPTVDGGSAAAELIAAEDSGEVVDAADDAVPEPTAEAPVIAESLEDVVLFMAAESLVNVAGALVAAEPPVMAATDDEDVGEAGAATEPGAKLAPDTGAELEVDTAGVAVPDLEQAAAESSAPPAAKAAMVRRKREVMRTSVLRA